MDKRFFDREKPALPLRGIHLDLKGLPPTPKRLLQLPLLLAEAGLNCLLVEWEDTFPWQRYPFLRGKTAYSRKTVELFLRQAQDLQIEVIPLVQSFGHLENVLSRKVFRNLQEISGCVSDLCPCRARSREVILHLVQDILALHPPLKYFHLGADEVGSLGSCSECRRRVAASGKADLYLEHLEPLFQFLHQQGIRPIIWDDMVRSWSVSELSRLVRQADLMCWNYAADPFHRLPHETLEKFAAAGGRLWAASAFKGADGPYVDHASIQVRLANMSAWVQQARKMKMVGAIATGWSRYNTFVSPCESLEVSLDTLVLSGKIAWDGYVPEDVSGWVSAFLNHCQKKGLPTSHFAACRQAAEKLQSWRETIFQQSQNLLHLACLNGEVERLNPFSLRQQRQAL
ncbi:MAG TPA: family 20 glycosylhydrolase, partial [bacterium]|nr:family 20 glycosylhydrolase [bacterium]